jgi:multidrug efflux pump subunit AcrA (membrane-fusion protein)
MNLVGKIFIVLIFVMSLVFMAFSMAVYATHKNWREAVVRTKDEGPGKPLGLQPQLDAAKKQLDEQRNEYDKLKRERDAEKAAATQAVAKLENELQSLTAERKKRDQEYADLVKAEREAVASMKTTQENMSHSEKERDTVEAQVLHAQQDRDAHFKEATRLTDELNQRKNDLEQLQKRMTTLAADLAKAKEALRYFDINENANFKDKTPPRVDGIVLTPSGAGLVEISIGSDQGLRVGHQLEVYRTTAGANAYVGRIEVVKTTPDRSVCKVEPKFQNSNMTRGDRVVSKIE